MFIALPSFCLVKRANSASNMVRPITGISIPLCKLPYPSKEYEKRERIIKDFFKKMTVLYLLLENPNVSLLKQTCENIWL
jgi:hypothetical protein